MEEAWIPRYLELNPPPAWCSTGKETALLEHLREITVQLLIMYKTYISIPTGNWMGTPVVGFGKVFFVYLKLD